MKNYIQKIKLYHKYVFILFLCFVANIFFCMYINSTFNTKSVQNELDLLNSYSMDIVVNCTGQDIDENILLNSNGNLPEAYCMRDDNIIYSQNQAQNGLCWAFAGTMSMSTAIAKATGEYYDFSENWISINEAKWVSSYIPGNGGNFSYIKNVPMVLESDCNYDISPLIEKTNINEYYNFYQKYANNNFWDVLKCENLGGGYNYDLNTISTIKSAIYNHSSVYAGMAVSSSFVGNGKTIVNGTVKTISVKEPFIKQNYSSFNGHAISIIGWDDDIRITTTYGNRGKSYTGTGAFIALNSWIDDTNNDGIVYILYDDLIYGDSNTNDFHTLYYVKYTSNSQYLCYFCDTIIKGYSYTTNLCGKYYNNFVGTEHITNTKNIFYTNNVDIKYSYTIANSTTLDSIKIYYDNVDVTKDFIVNIDRENKTFEISQNNVELGNYKIIITYSTGNISKKFINNFFVCNETEMSSSYISSGRYANLNGYYASFNTINLSNNYTYSKLASDVMKVSFYDSVYSNIARIYYKYDNSSITKEVYYNRSKNAYYAEISCGNYSLIKINIVARSGATRTINIKLFEKTNKNASTYIFYELNGGENNNQNYNHVFYSINIQAPTCDGLIFNGWYYDQTYTEAVMYSQEGYLLDLSKALDLGNNPNSCIHTDSDVYRSYYNYSHVLFLYAKWSEDSYSVNVIGDSNGTIEKDNVILNNKSTTDLLCTENVVYNFIPKNGYHISSLVINGVSKNENEIQDIMENGLSLSNVSQNYTIKVSFKNTYQATITGREYVNVSCNEDLNEMASGQDCIITLRAKFGYKITKVYINGEEVEITNDTITIQNVSNNIAMIIEAEENIWDTITIILIIVGAIIVIAVIFIITKEKRVCDKK